MYEKDGFNTKYRIISDYEWLLKSIFDGKKGVYLNREVVEYGANGFSSRSSNQKLWMEEHENMLKEFFESIGIQVSQSERDQMIYKKEVPDRIWDLIKDWPSIPIIQRKGSETSWQEEFVKARKLIARHHAAFSLLMKYDRFLSRGNSIAERLRERGYRNCAVYGLGYEGQFTINDLLSHSFEIKYLIDQNAEKLGKRYGIEAFTPVKGLPEVDVIIVTPVFYWRDIISYLDARLLICLEDLID